MRQCVFDAEPSTPGLSEQVYLAEAQSFADYFDLLYVTLKRPKAVVVGAVGSAAAKLIIGDDSVAITCKYRMAVTNVIAWQAGTAVQTQQHFVAGAETISDNFMSVYGNSLNMICNPIYAQ